MEVVQIKQKLTLMQQHNGNFLPVAQAASLIWDIVMDVAHFFDTFPTEDKFSKNS